MATIRELKLYFVSVFSANWTHEHNHHNHGQTFTLHISKVKIVLTPFRSDICGGCIHIMFEVTKFDSISLLLLLLLLPGSYVLHFWGKFISAMCAFVCVCDFILVWNSLSFLFRAVYICNFVLYFCVYFSLLSYIFLFVFVDCFMAILTRILFEVYAFRNGMSENTGATQK